MELQPCTALFDHTFRGSLVDDTIHYTSPGIVVVPGQNDKKKPTPTLKPAAILTQLLFSAQKDRDLWKTSPQNLTTVSTCVQATRACRNGEQRMDTLR